ncbi:MAG: type II toxin-antitoxin system VapC family toxin [Cyanobacteriota bacterium]|jgi:PIN domain nuclease of toxin-antitoxin system
MKILLDTHALLWFFAGHENMSQVSRVLVEDIQNLKLISIASVWEMAIKQSQGRLNLGQDATHYIVSKLTFEDFSILPIQLNHLELICRLPFYHRDPFDRLLISQSIVEQVPILTKDKLFEKYPVTCIWDSAPQD